MATCHRPVPIPVEFVHTKKYPPKQLDCRFALQIARKEILWHVISKGPKWPTLEESVLRTRNLLALTSRTDRRSLMDQNKSFSIFLADDDEDDCVLFQDALKEVMTGMNLVISSDGEELMNMLDERVPRNPR
jgi:hypothetical protein